MVTAIAAAQSSGDPSLWFSVISDLINKQEAKEKEDKEREEEKQKQKKAEAIVPKTVGLNVVIASPAKPTSNKVTSPTVIRRRASSGGV